MFEDDLLSDRLHGQWELAMDYVNQLSDVTLLARTVDELVSDVTARFSLEMPKLVTSQLELDDAGSGEPVELLIPFTGPRDLLRWCPDGIAQGDFIHARVVNDDVVITLGEAPKLSKPQIELGHLNRCLDCVRREVDAWHEDLKLSLARRLAERIQDAKMHRDTIESLGFPVRRRADAPPVFTEPIIERRPPPNVPVGRQLPAEPALSSDYYEHILYVIRAAGKAMERAPETYAGWSEPKRRDVLVLMLNTHYEGKVHAEAFNAHGKTDILIRSDDDKNVFIGECKFYSGPASVTDAIDQLFGYATWRDVKLAIVLFIERVGFTDAVRKARLALEAHPQWRQPLAVEHEPDTEFRALMAWPGDDERRVTLHISAFNTPLPEHAVADRDDGEDLPAKQPAELAAANEAGG
jgi:hypothetical protein